MVSPLPSSATLSTGFLVKLCKITEGVQVGTNVHVYDFACASNIAILSNNIKETLEGDIQERPKTSLSLCLRLLTMEKGLSEPGVLLSEARG